MGNCYTSCNKPGLLSNEINLTKSESGHFKGMTTFQKNKSSNNNKENKLNNLNYNDYIEEKYSNISPRLENKFPEFKNPIVAEAYKKMGEFIYDKNEIKLDLPIKG